jgi:YesN/AraC family two-component response regulator
MGLQKAIIKRRRSMAGFCTNGVYEYCRPVIYHDQVICAIFIGNILTHDPAQRLRLQEKVGSDLLNTMEQNATKEDCEKIADLLESYIIFLFEHYGNKSQSFDPLIENIKNHIRENIALDPSLEELAMAFHYSPKYLGRLFKARTGLSIKNYCNHTKVVYAKSLLINSTLSIDTIAAQSGFNSINYFDRVFYQIEGCSPKKFRNSKK